MLISVIMLSVTIKLIMLNISMLSVVMLNAMGAIIWGQGHARSSFTENGQICSKLVSFLW